MSCSMTTYKTKAMIYKKTKPILVNTEMVEAIVSGRKTQTRRPIKSSTGCYNVFMYNGKHAIEEADGDFVNTGKTIFPKYSTGDILWVRETWQLTDFLHPSDDNYGYIHKASPNGRYWEENSEGWIWKPSIHMPKVAARIFLKVTNVRIERLNDITEDDAGKEGVALSEHNCFKNYMQGKDWMYEGKNQNGYEMLENPIGSFASLWCSLYGEESWEKNDFVFVYDFELTDKPEDF